MYELKIVRERRPGYGRASQIRTAQDVFNVFRSRCEEADREVFLVLTLDGKNRVTGFNVVAVGSLTAALVHPREIFKLALLANSAAVILVHNHPSGDPEPSAEDRAITERLKQAGDLIGIRILDHVVIGDESYRSFAEEHLL